MTFAIHTKRYLLKLEIDVFDARINEYGEPRKKSTRSYMPGNLCEFDFTVDQCAFLHVCLYVHHFFAAIPIEIPNVASRRRLALELKHQQPPFRV